MSKRLILRLTIDFIMTVLLLTSFAYQLIGSLAHEVIGVIIFMLFIIHNVMNRSWYKNIFKGKYHIRRTIGIIVNLLFLVDMCVLAVSAIMISRNIFAFLNLDGGFEVRQIHTLAAYWGLVLVSIHLGLHWNIILGGLKKMMRVSSKSILPRTILHIFAALIVAYGIKSSFDMGIGARLTMESTFGYWDFENEAVRFFFDYISIMGLYIIVTYYTLALFQKFGKDQKVENK